MSSVWDSEFPGTGQHADDLDSNDITLRTVPSSNSIGAQPLPVTSAYARREEHRKRNRIVLSCLQCRRRKLKCDRQNPCGACIKRGTADECVFQRHDRSRENSAVLERRMETLEKLVRGLVGEQALQKIRDGTLSPSSHLGNLTSSPESSSEHSSQTNQTESVKPGYPHLSAQGRSQSIQGETTVEPSSGGLQDLNLAMGQLTVLDDSGGGTLYAGGTTWDSVFLQFAELKTLLKQSREGKDEAEDLQDSTSTGRSDVPSMWESPMLSEARMLGLSKSMEDQNDGWEEGSFPFSCVSPPSIRNIIAYLPTGNFAAQLIGRYFSSMMLFVRVVHEGTFRREYAEFLSAPDNVKPQFLALLFAVFAMGVHSLTPTSFDSINDSNLTYRQAIKLYYLGAKQALVLGRFMRNHTLHVIQCLVLLQVTIDQEDLTVSSWALHGATKNIALQMGLHREPSLFNVPEPEAEIRRRVWWCIYIQDRLSCVTRGIFVTFQDSDFDTLLPLNVDDSELDSDISSRRHSYPSVTDSPFNNMTIFCGQAIISKLLSRVISLTFGLRHTTYDQILRLDWEIQNFQKHLLPTCLRENNFNNDKDASMQMAIKALSENFVLKIGLVLHRPFIGRAHENSQFAYSRDRCIQCALNIIENQSILFGTANDISPSTALLNSHSGSYPMIAHGFFLAPVALALDLYTDPHQPNAEKVRLALLECRRQYLKISQLFAGVKRLYKVINVLMKKGWEKAGLFLPPDPDAHKFQSKDTSEAAEDSPNPILDNVNGANRQVLYSGLGIVPTTFGNAAQARNLLPSGLGQGMPSSSPTAQSAGSRGYDDNNWLSQFMTSDYRVGETSSGEGLPQLQPPQMMPPQEQLPLPNPQLDGPITWMAPNDWDVLVNSMDLDQLVNESSFF